MFHMHLDSFPDHPLRFLFIDFNSYFAAVEQHDDPSIRGRPVIVIPIASEHTGAIAASYEAKAIGISRGTPVREARRICPDIAVRPARHDRYVELHNRLMDEIGRQLPVTRVYSIDECVCRLDPREHRREAALAKAEEIKAAIALRVGPCLRSSIGIAPSPLLAKLASELKKPDGLVAIEAGELPGALENLPLRALPGVGEGVAGRLDKAGVKDFTSLWNLPPKQARAIWGSVVGERFLYALRGYDIPDDPPREKTMIGHSRVLSPQDQGPDRARIIARALLLKAATRLRIYKLHAGRLSLGLRLRPAGWIEYECAFSPSQNSWTFLRELNALWDRAIRTLKSSHLRNARIGLVSVDLHDLRDRGPEPDLFTPPEERALDENETSLWEKIDKLNQRYKGQVITLASQRGLDLNYLGVKIAFSRVPDAAEFHC
ncbi:MAG TPA: type VI secretion protein ImpB [Allosphingosinicella sp.]|nr:type VI secretion protein ImpB [Allosphingosinicella sp.]